MFTIKWLGTSYVKSLLLRISDSPLSWNQDSISCWIFVADNRDISKLKVEQIMLDSTSSVFVYRWDFMFHSWPRHGRILCFSSCHNQRRKEKPTRKPDRRHRLTIDVVLLFYLCQL
ncbi:hypothetical protein TorRG33x02_272340 [Trema orientale]|uniref:Uncharacterized protein n=1 Tax=Trema orientale TaxID=63057 RepID=A0A2P5CUV5_TREOI|nr:hypothetical protein TorRG33x02_272340 [Trema orientale]